MAIIDSENTNAWSLMHRFNRAADFLGDILAGKYEDRANACAALYAPVSVFLFYPVSSYAEMPIRSPRKLTMYMIKDQIIPKNVVFF